MISNPQLEAGVLDRTGVLVAAEHELIEYSRLRRVELEENLAKLISWVVGCLIIGCGVDEVHRIRVKDAELGANGLDLGLVSIFGGLPRLWIGRDDDGTHASILSRVEETTSSRQCVEVREPRLAVDSRASVNHRRVAIEHRVLNVSSEIALIGSAIVVVSGGEAWILEYYGSKSALTRNAP